MTSERRICLNGIEDHQRRKPAEGLVVMRASGWSREPLPPARRPFMRDTLYLSLLEPRQDARDAELSCKPIVAGAASRSHPQVWFEKAGDRPRC